MGVLADIYSGGNTLKRRLNALVDDPAGTLALGVTRFGEDQNELLNLLTNAYPMAGERTVLNSPEQVDAFGREVAHEVTNRMLGMLGIDPKAPQIASALIKGGENLLAPATLNSQAGVIGFGNRPKYLRALVDVLKSGKADDVAFGAVSPRNEKHVNALRELLGQPLIQRGGQWVIPQNVVQKLMDKRMGMGGMSAEKVADTLNSAVHSSRNRVFQSEYPQIQGVVTPKEGFSNIGFVGVNPRTGDPVIKSGYKIETDRINKAMKEGDSLRAGRSSAIAKADESASYRSAIPEHTGNSQSMPQPGYSPQYQAALDAGLDMSFEARMQRAAEQGYTMPVYHGSNSGDIAAFDPEKFRATVQYMPGAFTADSPEQAIKFGDVIYPFLQRQGVSVLDKVKAVRAGLPAPVVDSIHNKAAGIHVTNDPANLRSVNAAFNPANIGKADLLGRINPQLLPWLTGGGLLSEAMMNRDK